MNTNEAVDTAQNEEAVETEATEQDDALQVLNDKLTDLEELVNHYKSEANKYKEEAKKAFQKRDEVKKSLRETKQNDDNDELLLHLETLKQQLQEKEQTLANIELEKERNSKLSEIKQVAKEQGMKDIYLDKLDKFVDLDQINVSKKATMKYQIESIRASFPDLFGEAGKRIDNALPSPNLTTGGNISFQEEYNKEKRKGINADMNKLIELKRLMSEQ